MVIMPDEGERERSRAQLILIGSIAIALVIVGLVVIINTVLFTENIATSESAERASEAAEFEFQTRRDTRSLILRLNHDQRRIGGPTLADRIEGNITTFERLLRESRASQDGAWVEINYHNGSSDWGERIVKGEGGPLTAPDGSENWDVVGDSDGTVGRLILNVNVSETSETPYYINVSNASEYINLSIYANEPGANANVSIDATLPSDDFEYECNPSRGVVLLDVQSGESFTGDCTFNGTGGLAPPTNVTVSRGSNGYGKFGLVANESVPNYRVDPGSPSGGTLQAYDTCATSPGETCRSPIVWSANVTYRYESRTINFTRTENLSIYP